MGSPGRRLELREIFTEILGTTGQAESRVYFQPPASVRMRYPAIVYRRGCIQNRYADDRVYLQRDAWEITVIDTDPDSDIVRAVSQIPGCRHDRFYTADNLYHNVFTLYY